MASLYECDTWTLSLNGVELMGLDDYTSGRPFQIPDQSHTLQVEPFARSQGVSIWDRENISHNFSITVLHKENSELEARASLLQHMVTLQTIGDGNLVMRHVDGNGLVYDQAGISNATPIERDADIGNDLFWGVTYQFQLGVASLIEPDFSEINSSSTNILASNGIILASHVQN